MLLRQKQIPWLDPLSWDALHHAALDNLKLQEGSKSTTDVQAHSKNNHSVLFRCYAYLVVVSPLLNELVNYFLGLFVTFLLQVSDECV